MTHPHNPHTTATKAACQARRQSLLELMAANSAALLPAALITKRNSDVEHPYRQTSDFFWLTGFNEPKALLVLMPGRKRKCKEEETILFCREKDLHAEQWMGKRLGPQQAIDTLNVDAAFDIADLDTMIPTLLKGCSNIYCDLGDNPIFDQQVISWLGALSNTTREGIEPPHQITSLKHELHELRLHKSAAEINTMACAAEITAKAHRRAMISCRPGISELAIEAELLHEFAIQGARWPAYPSIVGGGERACILHYTDNNHRLEDGELLLVDAGCEFDGYAADLTRTFPVNGLFTGAQKALYEIVLAAQLATIDQCRVGQPYDSLQQTTNHILTEGLLDLGLLEGELTELIETHAAQPFSVHKVGHWLGMDVHDVGRYTINGKSRLLEPDMVTTVEPGLYIPTDCEEAPSELRGIGIRIEDDIVITSDKPQVLTADAPKEIADIEHLMRS